MASLPPGFADVSIELRLSLYVRPAFITFGIVDEVGALTPTEQAAAVRTAFMATGSINRWMDDSVTASTFTVRAGTESGEPLVGTATNTIPGGGGYSSPPPNCAVLIHKRTTRGGRRGRGRLFIPWFVDETQVSESGQFTTTWMGNMQGAANVFHEQLESEGVPMVLLHGEGNTPEGAPNVVVALEVDPVISTQRRRLLR